LILYIYLIMDAQLIPQEQVSQEQEYCNNLFKLIKLLENDENILKSKNLVKILELYCDKQYDIIFISNSAIFEMKYRLLIDIINANRKKIWSILHTIKDILWTIYMYSKKSLLFRYFESIVENYNQKINVGDIVIYEKRTKIDNGKTCLCRINKITDKSIILENIYTNAITFRKNLYGEKNYKFAYTTPQMTNYEINEDKVHYQLFTEIFQENTKNIIHRKNSKSNNKNLHLNWNRQIKKIYKNNEGVYCFRNKLEGFQILRVMDIGIDY